ncbi:MAG: dual specificity protein phosphatase family protein [Planctomycetes bacterium]|nr:dual specificity protein phosphatase family protein [Planctomycetota bacterium]
MPINFGYVIEGELAGMERPGSHAPLDDDLDFLRNQGIGAIVSLTEHPLDQMALEPFGFRYLHLPVEDFTAPTLPQIRAFIEFYEKAQAEKTPVVVHCAAGYGRTGTLLACVLVHKGRTAAEAIEQLRQMRPHSIETTEQELMIQNFEWVARRRS